MGVEPSNTPLASISPNESNQTGGYEIVESILLDTSGAPSLLAVTTRATGYRADALRQRLSAEGADPFAEERLQNCAKRYATAKRVGAVRHRDDREANELVMVEVFEISGFLGKHIEPNMCAFRLPGNLVTDALRLSGNSTVESRLPFPCNVTHTFEVHSTSLQPMAAPRLNINRPYLQFSRRQKSLHKYWSMTLSLSTLCEAVPPNLLAQHEKLVSQIAQESAWSLFMPVGVVHPRRPHDFGQLPPVNDDRAASSQPSMSSRAGVSDAPAARPDGRSMDGPILGNGAERARSGRTDLRRIRTMRTRHVVWLVILSLSILIIGYLLFFMVGVRQLGF